MGKATIATTLLIVGGVLGLASSISLADEQGGLSIADNDSVYVDGKSFQVIPGKAKGDVAVQIKTLSARELGPAAIIMRSGNRLYIADAQSQTASSVQVAAAAPSYAYDPRAYNPRLLGGGSAGYNYNVATDYAYDPRAYPIRDPNPWAHDYAYDPNFMPPTSVIYDPDYVAYRLRKAFAENWTPSAAAMGDSH